VIRKNQEDLPQIYADGRGSGGLAAQFRERAGSKDKMLHAQSLSPFQSRRRGQNDDPIRGLKTMAAAGNFFKDPI
jgi:hypothetical protein